MRSTPEQTWPQLKKDAHSAPSTARARSASSSTTIGSLPPSSSVTGTSRSPAAAATRRPTSLEPVKSTLPRPRARTSAAPTSPSPCATRTRAGGAPASANSCSTSAPDRGVSSDGLSTTAFPAATAYAACVNGIAKGKFQGAITPTTPSGSYSSCARLCFRCSCGIADPLGREQPRRVAREPRQCVEGREELRRERFDARLCRSPPRSRRRSRRRGRARARRPERGARAARRAAPAHGAPGRGAPRRRAPARPRAPAAWTEPTSSSVAGLTTRSSPEAATAMAEGYAAALGRSDSRPAIQRERSFSRTWARIPSPRRRRSRRLHRERLVQRLRLAPHVEGVHADRPLPELLVGACVLGEDEHPVPPVDERAFLRDEVQPVGHGVDEEDVVLLVRRNRTREVVCDLQIDHRARTGR